MNLKCLVFSLMALITMMIRPEAATVIANVAKDGIAAANQALYGNANPQLLIDGSKAPQIHGDVNLVPGFAYTVDLGKDYSVSELKIYPRQDGCCPERLTNFRISLHVDEGGAMGAEVWGANQFTDGSNPGSGAGMVFSIPLPTPQTGRWIEIRSLADPVPNYALQINELEVFAAVQPTEVNRALGALATVNQVTYAGAPAANLVDGNRGSIIHGDTGNTPGFAYDINLGVEVTMTKIDIFARQDGCCPDRLSNYRVSVHKNNNGAIGDKVWSADLHADLSNPGSGLGAKDTITADLDPVSTTFKGQWIRIETLDDPVAPYSLQVAEVEVFGTIPDAVTLILTSEPADAAVGVGGNATFTVGVNAINADPAQLVYQWQKNGQDIPGANSATYVTPTILSGDSGSKYKVTVSYPGVPTLTSREALLRINYAVGGSASANGPLWGPGGFNMQQIVDGNRRNFLHGDAVLPTGFAYQVRLGGQVNFESIDIYPRDNCCPDRLSNIRVSVHSDNAGAIGAEVWGADLFTDGSNAGAVPVHVVAGMNPGGTFSGQWIKITVLADPVPAYALQLAEIEAFGTLLDTAPKVTILQQSSQALAALGRSATISVTANVFNGVAANITYQWRKDGVAIPGATDRVYTTAILQQADLGAKYTVAVSYPGIPDVISAEIPVVFDSNYSRGGQAFNNQKLWVGVPTWNIRQIVDGDVANFVHGDTGLLPGYAYSINMGDEVTLSNIEVWVRQDGCCPGRVSNLRVSIHKDNGGQLGDQVWSADFFTDGSNAGSGPGAKFSVTPEMDPAGTFKGQWIKIMDLSDPVLDYTLQIGEVEAFGTIAGRPQLLWTTAGGLTLTWTDGVLESTADLNVAFAPVNGALSPYTPTRGDPARFFRLKK